MLNKEYSAWCLKSRVHRLNHFPNQDCYVKREDELSCGISGNKLRKYSSIIPYCLDNEISHLVIIASTQSNNLLAAVQLACEYGFDMTLFLLKPRDGVESGNFKLSQLFIDERQIVWIERANWPHVETLANEYIASFEGKTLLLPEGASAPQALLGAKSIVRDIKRNEHELGLQFKHVFIDAGTGFSACALLAGMIDANHRAQIHVLLLADDECCFWQKCWHWAKLKRQEAVCFYPTNARSFGAVNKTVKNEVKRMATEEGILTDPIYSAKLFYESRKKIEQDSLDGPLLIIHSGGILSLSHFTL